MKVDWNIGTERSCSNIPKSSDQARTSRELTNARSRKSTTLKLFLVCPSGSQLPEASKSDSAASNFVV